MTENKGKNNRDETYKNTRNQRILDKLHHGHKLKKKGKKKKKKKTCEILFRCQARPVRQV